MSVELPAGTPASTSDDGVRMQILATEHWSLLASRSLGYTDSFSRATMFFSVLSGTVIALALIAQAGRFDTARSSPRRSSSFRSSTSSE